MNQRHIFTTLAIIAVTGSLSVPNSLAMAWRLDVSDRHVVARGGLEWDPLIYTGLATSTPPDVQLEYDYIWPEQATQNERSRYGMKGKSSPSSEARQAETQPYGNYSPTGQSSVSTTGALHEYLSGVPTTPSADPLVQELSHAPSPR